MDHLAAAARLVLVHLLALMSPESPTVLVVQTSAVSGRAGRLIAAAAMMTGALAGATAAPFSLQAPLQRSASDGPARAFYRQAKVWLGRIMGGAQALLGLRLALSSR